MTARADIWLGIHDASRIEWIAELPLPERGEEDLELELSVEVPRHIWTPHDQWERLQLMARLASPVEDVGGHIDHPDDVRRASLGAVRRLKDARDHLEKELFRAASLFADAVREEMIAAICAAVRDDLAELRRERDVLRTPGAAESEEMARERRLAAEFLSNHVLEYLSTIQRAVDIQLEGPRADRAGLEEAAKPLQALLAAQLAEELGFREAAGLLRPDGTDPLRLERYVSRASDLKKHFQEVLFLDLEAQRSDRRFRNFFGIIAASLAALWAFPAGFILTGGSGVTGLGLGLTTTVALLVASYAVKDRIKESVRSWLLDRVERGWAGRTTSLEAPPRLLGSPLRLARVRESFLAEREERPDRLNPEIGGTRPVVRLRYRLRGTITGDPRLAWHGHERMKFVFRYDLSALFTRLDDPFKEVPVLSDDGSTVRFAEAPRSYRMPIRLELRHRDVLQTRDGVLVAHKLGLERIDRLAHAAGIEVQVERQPALSSIPWPAVRRR